MYTLEVGEITMKRKLQIIKTGYISRNHYTDRFQFNSEIGVKERQMILEMLETSLKELSYNDYVLSHQIVKRGNNLTLEIRMINQVLRLNFDTINSIVTRNKDRKINQKSFLPYDKGMDKYNSIYVSVEANNVNDDTYDTADEILSQIMGNMNLLEDLYYFKSMIIKDPIVV